MLLLHEALATDDVLSSSLLTSQQFKSHFCHLSPWQCARHKMQGLCMPLISLCMLVM